MNGSTAAASGCVAGARRKACLHAILRSERVSVQSARASKVWFEEFVEGVAPSLGSCSALFVWKRLVRWDEHVGEVSWEGWQLAHGYGLLRRGVP